MTAVRQAKAVSSAPAAWDVARAASVLRKVASILVDPRSLLGQTAQTFATSALVAVANLAASVLTARSLGVQGRGEITALLLWLQLLPFLGTLGLPTAFTYYAKKHRAHAPSLLAPSLLLIAAGGAVVTLAACWFAPAMFRDQSADWKAFSQSFLLIGVPVAVLMHFGTNAAQSFARLGLYNAARLFHPLCYLFMVVVLWAAGRMSVVATAISYVAAGLILLSWLTVYFWREFQPRFRQSAPHLKAYLTYGMGAYAVDATAALINQIDKLFVLGMLSLRDLGLYSVAFSLSRILVLFQNSVASVLLPATAGKQLHWVVAAAAQACRASMALSILASLPLLLFGHWILATLFGADFEAAAATLRLLTLDIMVAAAAWILSQAYYAVGRPWLVVMNHAISLMALAGLLFYWVPIHGIAGAAAALLGASLLRLAVTLAIFALVLHAGIPRLLPRAEDFKLAYRRIKEVL